jgi:phage antirepressor YoqD-like protein
MTELQIAVQNELEKLFKDPAQLRALLIRQSETIEAMTPKAEFYDAVADSKDWFDMNKASKYLAIKNYGRNNTFIFLRGCKVLRSNNEPYQEFVDRGYFKIIMQKYLVNGEWKLNPKTLVSSKGLDYIRKLIKEVQ